MLVNEFDVNGAAKRIDIATFETFYQYWKEHQPKEPEYEAAEESDGKVYSDDSEEMDAVALNRQKVIDSIHDRITKYFEDNDVRISDLFSKVKNLDKNKFLNAIMGAGLTEDGGDELRLTQGEQTALYNKYNRGKYIDID